MTTAHTHVYIIRVCVLCVCGRGSVCVSIYFKVPNEVELKNPREKEIKI